MATKRRELGQSPPPQTPPAQGAGNVGLIVIIVGGLWLLFDEHSPLRFGRPRRGG